MGPWFIETLARNGDVLHRHRVERLPIRIGRGYDNDYILDDVTPYLSEAEGDHYEETNSIGPSAVPLLLEAADTLMTHAP